MTKNLVIVESPAKAKTIEKYLGKDYSVLSSVGHVRSIAKKTASKTPPVDVNNNFETTYEIDPEKRKVIAELKKAVKNSDEVWLATDDDREGEAIAWHLTEVLGLDAKKTKRIVFNEITKQAIEEAIKHPRTIDFNLVRAQQARQILDRLVGFELSPVVWQKVPGGKSAGRVQSPAVRLLVEREREIQQFESESSYKINATFLNDNNETINAEFNQKPTSEEEANNILTTIAENNFTVSDVKKTDGKRNPPAPFTTSTLQQTANNTLGFSARATMSSAQKLYQEGKITYMRTDSVHLSGQAINGIQSYINNNFGEKYSQVRQFKTKSANAQEAHEAIRPTDISASVASSNPYDQKLYTLIRNRTLASQMASAVTEKTTVTINGDNLPNNNYFEAKGEVIVFDGFLKVYGSKQDDTILPPISSGMALRFSEAIAKQVFSRPPARFTEGSLVKKLEELGIGRPSTYATILGNIQLRGYAEKGEGEGNEREIKQLTVSAQNTTPALEIITEKTGANKGKLLPTPSGELISDFLTNHFDQIVDYGFTAQVEEEFDEIAQGNINRNDMLHGFYTPFHELVEKSGDIDRTTVAKAREIGTDPKTGKIILARFGRFGPMLQLGATEDEEKPRFAPLPKGKRLETVTLEDALTAFTLPREVGQTADGTKIEANVGRFGPYIKVGPLFVSIKTLDPHTITLNEALELYEEKLQQEREKNIADFGDGIKVLNGRFGPYVTDGKKNAKIPKDEDPKTITHEQAKELLNKAPAKKSTRKATKKAVKKTAKKPAKKSVKKPTKRTTASSK